MSTETKHTPGPWEHITVEGGWDGVAPKTCGLAICKLVENNPANADLIAAAPELLRELEATTGLLRETARDLAAIIQVIDSTPALNRVATLAKLSAVNCERYEQRARAAIAKATGA